MSFSSEATTSKVIKQIHQATHATHYKTLLPFQATDVAAASCPVQPLRLAVGLGSHGPWTEQDVAVRGAHGVSRAWMHLGLGGVP